MVTFKLKERSIWILEGGRSFRILGRLLKLGRI
jgi:hypothetical protein